MDMSVSMLLKLVDQFSAPLDKARSKIGDFRKASNEAVSKPFKKAVSPLFDPSQFDANIERNRKKVQDARSKLVGAFGGILTLAAPLKLAAGFDQAFKGLEKVVDAPKARLKELRDFALDTSAKVPIAARDLLSLMAEAAQGGVPTAELEKFSLFVAKAAVAADMGAQEIGEVFAKLRNNYKLTQKTIEQLGDSANHLSNSMAVKARQIFDFTNRAAGAAKILQLSAVEMNAIAATLVASGIVPETAARGFNAFATKILNGGKKVDAAFKSVGLSRKAVLADFRERGAIAFSDFITTLAGKGDKGAKAIAAIVGQDFSDDFMKLLANPDLLKKALQSISDPSKFKGSIVEEAAKQAEGAENQFQLLAQQITAVGIQIGDVLIPPVLELVTSLGSVIKEVSKFAEANPELFSSMVQVAGGAIALGVAMRILGFAWAVTGGALLRLIPLLTKASGILLALATGGGKTAAALGAMFAGLKAAGVGALAALAAAGWPVVAVMAALSAAGLAIWKYWDQLTSLLKGIGTGLYEGFAPDMAAMEKDWNDLVAGISGLGKRIADAFGFDGAAVQLQLAKAFDFSGVVAGLQGTQQKISAFFSSLFSESKATDAEKANWEALGRRIGEAIVGAIKLPFNTLGTFILDTIKASIDNGWDGLLAYVKGKIAELKNLFKIDFENPFSGLFGADEKKPNKENAATPPKITRPNSERALAKRTAPTKPKKPTSSDATVLGRDFISGMDKLQKSGALLEKSADSAGKKIETSSRNAGDLLGDRAGAKLRQRATEAGTAFGTAAAAKIAAAAANIKVSASPGRAPGRAKAAALHDGVD